MSPSTTQRSTEPFTLEDTRDDLPFQIHWELDDAPLSVWAFRIYAHLVRRAGKNGEIFPSYQSIGEACFRATYGASANPKSLRNKAMMAMKELVQAGLVFKQERNRKGTGESDTNVYKLTPRRQWLEEMKVRRTTLETATIQAQDAKRMDGKTPEGGTVGMPRGTVGVLGGIPTVPKVISREVISKEEEEISSRARMSEAAKAPRDLPHLTVTQPPETVSLTDQPGPFSAALEKISSSSLSPAALEQPDQAQPETGNGAAPAQQVSSEREKQSPNGEAAPVLAFTEEDLDDLLPLEIGNDQAPQDVPGAAGGEAAADVVPCVAELRPLPARVLEFAPVPAPELESRLPALPVSELHRLLVELLGEKDLLVMLSEKTRSGNLPRERWLLLGLAEVQAVEMVANAEHAATGTSLRTLIARGLDRLIGSPWTGQKKPAASAPVIGGHSLEAAKKPALEPEAPEEGKLKPGAQYRRKSDGAPVELVKTERVKNKFGDGEKWVLSDGSLVGAMDLVLKFEFVGRATASA